MVGLDGRLGECLPYHDNKIYLSKTDKDKWGSPSFTSTFHLKKTKRK